MKSIRVLIGVIAAAVVSACGGGGSSSGYTTGVTNPGTGGTPNPGTPATTNTVTLSDQTFQPGVIAVPKGTTVTWNWASCTDTGGYGGYAGCVSHSVTFDDGIASPTQSSGTFNRTFNSTGTFKYHCAVHGAAMTGQVNVQ